MSLDGIEGTLRIREGRVSPTTPGGMAGPVFIENPGGELSIPVHDEVFTGFPPLTMTGDKALLYTDRSHATGPFTATAGRIEFETGPQSEWRINGGMTLGAGARMDPFLEPDGSGLRTPMVVTGAVVLGSAALLVDGRQLQEFLGQEFVLIQKVTPGSVSGTFRDLPEGGLTVAQQVIVGQDPLINANTGVVVRVSYVGGDGNDVSLTLVRLTGRSARWTGNGANGFWSNPANWEGNTVPEPGDALFFTTGAARRVMTNDLPDGILYHALDFQDEGFELHGNSLGARDEVNGGSLAAITLVQTDLRTEGADWRVQNEFILEGSVLEEASNEAGEVRMRGPGTLVLRGNASNPITLTHHEGRVRFEKANGASACGFATVGGSGGMAFLDIAQSGAFELAATLGIQAGGQASSAVNTTNSMRQLLVNGGTMILAAGSELSAATVGFTSASGPVASLVIDLGGPGQNGRIIAGFRPSFSGVNLTLNLAGHSPADGESFVLIRNDDTDPVQGTFNGLPEGGVLLADTHLFRVSYSGGDGNDVVLAAVTPPRVSEIVCLTDGTKQLNVTEAPPGSSLVLEATPILLTTPSLIQWVPLRTNVANGLGTVLFLDSAATNFQQRFYRVRLQ